MASFAFQMGISLGLILATHGRPYWLWVKLMENAQSKDCYLSQLGFGAWKRVLWVLVCFCASSRYEGISLIAFSDTSVSSCIGVLLFVYILSNEMFSKYPVCCCC